jgi:UDPglucose 6-dehydrogenase
MQGFLVMRIVMIGTGYVGLVSGACFADFGHQVVGVEKDAGKLAALGRGEIPNLTWIAWSKPT